MSKGIKNGKIKKRTSVSFQAPDGGWGWMIMFGTALAHMLLIPLLQNFTLLFKDRFFELGFTSTDITTLVCLNASFGMILGIFNGPILKLYGYRKLALVGGTLFIIGNLFTGLANTYAEFIIFYGLLSSLGVMTTITSYSMALNSYFYKKRSKAVGYAMTLTGLGPIFAPVLISELLSCPPKAEGPINISTYAISSGCCSLSFAKITLPSVFSSFGLKWTVLILFAITLHLYVAALLLQPIKWHLKPTKVEKNKVEDPQLEEQENINFLPEANSIFDISLCDSMSLSNRFESSAWATKSWSQDFKELFDSGFKENKKQLSVSCLDNEDYENMMTSTLHIIENSEINGQVLQYASAETLSINTKNPDALWEYEQILTEPLKVGIYPEQNGTGMREDIMENSKSGLLTRCLFFLKDIYDLDLLHDIHFLNIMVGLSIALVGEIIFSTMTPFIFKEEGFNTEETAKFMAVIAGSDLVCRFIAPYVGKQLKLNSKKMYIIALFMLVLSRAFLYLASSTVSYFIVSFALGIGKGFRSVYWILVMPDYVPLSKLPSASAFQSLANGLLLLTTGPLIGAIIAINNRYSNLILASNILTLMTIGLWVGEMIFLRCAQKKTKESKLEPQSADMVDETSENEHSTMTRSPAKKNYFKSYVNKCHESLTFVKTSKIYDDKVQDN